jgi:hypothetical protein
MPCFYEESVINRYSVTKLPDEDGQICGICEENKVNVMLDCNVIINNE